MEIWKDVVGYEGLYKLNINGDVFSNYKNRLLKKQKGCDGYYYYSFYKNSKRKVIKIHKIVAEVFIKNDSKHPCINHINGIKTDNRIQNLEWCTYSHNIKEAYRIGLKKVNVTDKNNFKANNPSKKGENNHNSKKVFMYDLQGNFIRSFNQVLEASNFIGVSWSLISRVCKGKRRHTRGYVFKYE